MSFIPQGHPQGLYPQALFTLASLLWFVWGRWPRRLDFPCLPLKKGGEQAGIRAKRDVSLPTLSLNPFPGFVCKLLGRQCGPAALLSQEKGQRGRCGGLWPSLEARMGRKGPSGLLGPPPILPQRGSEPSWAVGQGTGSLPGCLQPGGLCTSEIGFFISCLVICLEQGLQLPRVKGTL